MTLEHASALLLGGLLGLAPVFFGLGLCAWLRARRLLRQAQTAKWTELQPATLLEARQSTELQVFAGWAVTLCADYPLPSPDDMECFRADLSRWEKYPEPKPTIILPPGVQLQALIRPLTQASGDDEDLSATFIPPGSPSVEFPEETELPRIEGGSWSTNSAGLPVYLCCVRGQKRESVDRTEIGPLDVVTYRTVDEHYARYWLLGTEIPASKCEYCATEQPDTFQVRFYFEKPDRKAVHRDEVLENVDSESLLVRRARLVRHKLDEAARKVGAGTQYCRGFFEGVRDLLDEGLDGDLPPGDITIPPEFRAAVLQQVYEAELLKQLALARTASEVHEVLKLQETPAPPATYAELWQASRTCPPDEREKQIGALIRAQALTVNELRSLRGLPPVPSGDVSLKDYASPSDEPPAISHGEPTLALEPSMLRRLEEVIGVLATSGQYVKDGLLSVTEEFAAHLHDFLKEILDGARSARADAAAHRDCASESLLVTKVREVVADIQEHREEAKDYRVFTAWQFTLFKEWCDALTAGLHSVVATPTQSQPAPTAPASPAQTAEEKFKETREMLERTIQPTQLSFVPAVHPNPLGIGRPPGEWSQGSY